MYKYDKGTPTALAINTSYEAEPLERKIERMMTNKEPIGDPTQPMYYTERKDGVNPDMDPRADRWEAAIDAFDKIDKTHKARRLERHKQGGKDKEPQTTENQIGGPESIQGTKV